MRKPSGRKPGKRAEPAHEELEFIQERILKGLSDAEIIVDIQGTTFPLRTTAFIKRRRKELDVARTVLEKQAEGAYDPDRFQRKNKHRDRLSERAQEIMEHLKTYFPYVDDRPIIDCLVEEDDFVAGSLLSDYRSRCLLTHLKNECDQLRDLQKWEDLGVGYIREWDLISILGSKADKGMFEGTCDVCKE